ncbi:Tyrosine-protein phosphatase YopH [Pandoraea terrae]|uniref:protein-tyrosine-phosphatase n=1 Tax=Pandoraea terrae TaxID=1537710 RepID=A0A5E4T9J7_9BURK|nr:protein-tyrosine phosphatase family protein [Pandoraea terrae]VVD84151.1 Tyrosine-protein phosphatase YopH [Pandoraea terrae]
MTSIDTLASSARMDRDDANRILEAVHTHSPGAATTMVGVTRQGGVVLFTGLQFLLHPRQTQRARSLIADHLQSIGFDRYTFLPRLYDQPATQWITRNLGQAQKRQYESMMAKNADYADRRFACAPKPELERVRGTPPQMRLAGTPPVKMSGVDQPVLRYTTPHETVNDILGTADNKVGRYLQLQCSGEGGTDYATRLPSARFSDVHTARHTMISAPDGTQLPANVVKIDGREVAIACQYPLDAFMQHHFEMLMAQAPSMLVVLAGTMETSSPWDVPYFAHRATAGQIEVEHYQIGKLDMGRHEEAIHVHRLALDTGKSCVSFPVVHVTGWPDHQSMPAEDIKSLIDVISDVRSLHPPLVDGHEAVPGAIRRETPLPIVHCRAGVGRTGTLIGAMALLKDRTLPLETIVTDMRLSRSPMMVQTKNQLNTLVDIALENGNPLPPQAHKPAQYA